MPKVLDYTGLQIYNEKIKSYIYPEVDTLEDLSTIELETYKDKKSIRIYCKENNSLYKIKLNEDGSIIDNNGFYEFEKISEGKEIQFYDTHKDLPINASKDDLAYVRGTSTKSLINVDGVAEIVNRHSDIYLHLNDELILYAGVLNESTVIHITNSDTSIMYYYLGNSGVINGLKNTNPDFFVGLSPKVGDWLIKLNNEFKIEKDFTIPFDEEKVKEQIGEEETKQLKSELFPPEKSSGYSGLFVYNGTNWVMNNGSVECKNVILAKADGTEKSLQDMYDDNELGGSGLPEPESKDKLLISVENAETTELEWAQVDKMEVASGGLKSLSLTDYQSFMDNLVISADGYVAP